MIEQTKLTLHEVEILLRTTADSSAHKPSGWLTIHDSKLLLTAIEHDAEQVYLTDMGRYFDIQYKYDKVWLTPSREEFTPCGWFSPSELQRGVRSTCRHSILIS